MQHLQPIAVTFDETAAERLDLSLHVFADQLLFSVVDPSVPRSEEAVLISGTLPLIRELAPSKASPVADRIYAHSFLTFPYHSVKIRFSPTAYLLVPPGLDDELLNERWLATAQLPFQESDYVGAFALPSAIQVLVAWCRETFNFLRRTYIKADIEPLIIDVLASARRLSLLRVGRVFSFFVESEAIDVAVLHRGELLFCNRFEISPYAESTSTFPGKALFAEEKGDSALPTERVETSMRDEAEVDCAVAEGKAGGGEVLAEQLLFYWAAVCRTLAIEELAGDAFRLFLSPTILANSTRRERIAVLLKNEVEAGEGSFELLSYSELVP